MRSLLNLLGVAVVVGVVVAFVTRPSSATDHGDPASRVAANAAADLGDLYAWHDDQGRLVLILTFAGKAAPETSQIGTYDRDIRYVFHIDNNGDYQADHEIEVRFGQSESGQWGARFSGIPGQSAPLVASVNDAVNAGMSSVFAGLRDDPAFLDLSGVQAAVSSGNLDFDSTRDSLAGSNCTAIVVQTELGPFTESGTKPNLNVWATTSQIAD